MLLIKFSWRIFVTTVILGMGIIFPLEIIYASFISSSVNQNNSIISGYWITPTITPLPTATLTPAPTLIIEPTETPIPTETIEPTVTDNPIPTETVMPSPTGPQVVINEYMPLPPTETTDWVEIYNPSAIGVDISGWKLRDSGTSSMGTIPQNTIISGNGFIVVSVGTRLNNSSDDMVRLFNASDNLIDSTSYLGANVETDKTFGRETDGTGGWKKCTSPSQGLTNNSVC